MMEGYFGDVEEVYNHERIPAPAASSSGTSHNNKPRRRRRKRTNYIEQTKKKDQHGCTRTLLNHRDTVFAGNPRRAIKRTLSAGSTRAAFFPINTYYSDYDHHHHDRSGTIITTMPLSSSQYHAGDGGADNLKTLKRQQKVEDENKKQHKNFCFDRKEEDKNRSINLVHQHCHYGTNQKNYDFSQTGSEEQNLTTESSDNKGSHYRGTCDHDLDNPSFPRSFFRHLFYDPNMPEFTTKQQTTWAVILGIVMGLFTAAWGVVIETLVKFVWSTIPKYLLIMGIFTDIGGHLPLPHYIWMCPAFFGGILSYITAKYSESGNPIPGQNDWIKSLHTVGVIGHSRLFELVAISTLTMVSGLSLGAEMPLILSSGMVGSWLAIKTNQSILSARALNLVAASAAVSGFFGFPIAGALFVLELPHRMGLKYFEALLPCVIGSIISVITNRMVTKKFVAGYFKYPFLPEFLLSDIYHVIVIYGIFGTMIGIVYVKLTLRCMKWVQTWFRVAHGKEHDVVQRDVSDYQGDEITSLVGIDTDLNLDTTIKKSHGKPRVLKDDSFLFKKLHRFGKFFSISHEPTRACISGVLVGVMVGVICMFLPHQLFPGRDQLQTLIDKGKTPLPVFEYEGQTSILTHYGYCMIDPTDERAQIMGLSTACVGILAFTKILTIGLSLGTGICGGHFWGPLYVGCAAGHFFSDIMAIFKWECQLAQQLAMFPCITILCVMGCVHVVTYRCHMAIVLVLTLTITSFTSEIKSGQMAGDYSAIFPLLAVACFVPMITARRTIFYGEQQKLRQDISAIPWVLRQATLHPEQYHLSNPPSKVEDNYSCDGISVGGPAELSNYEDSPLNCYDNDEVHSELSEGDTSTEMILRGGVGVDRVKKVIASSPKFALKRGEG